VIFVLLHRFTSLFPVCPLVTVQVSPFDRILAFLDPLLRRAPLVVEPHHPFGGLLQIGHDEPDAREQFAVVPLHFGHHATSLIPTLGRRAGLARLVMSDPPSLRYGATSE
jgi:hypothetical protein